MSVAAWLPVALLAAAGCSVAPPPGTGRRGDGGAGDGVDGGGVPVVTDGGDCVVRHDVVVNGSFSEGNTGFTTDLTHSPADLLPESTYAVAPDPRAIHRNFPAQAEGWADHGDGDDNLSMLINGSPDATHGLMWKQRVPVVAGTRYNFHAYVRSLYQCPCASVSAVVLSTDGSAAATLASNVAATAIDHWVELSAVWTATETGMVDLVFQNAETAHVGNDVAIDDVGLFAEEAGDGCTILY